MARQRPPESLSTQRLLLRPSRPEDAAVYRQLWTERDPRVPHARRLDADGRPSIAAIASDIRAESFAADGSYALLAVQRQDAGDVIGYCGLVTGGVTFPDGASPTEPELAYELLRSAQGQGYATEAARAVVAWSADAGCSRLWATVRDWNSASLRVLDKLGFKDTGEREPEDGHGASLIMVRTA